MQEITAVVNIGQLVTLAGPTRPRAGKELGELAIVKDAALIARAGEIIAIGDYSELRSKIPAGARVVNARQGCVTPGFVDAHTHMVFAGNRAAEFEQRNAGVSYQEIAAAGGGILSTVRSTRAASDDELLAQARRNRDWMLRGGTTTIEAKSGYGLEAATELRMLRTLAQIQVEGPATIVPTLLAAHAMPPEFADRREEYIHWICNELIPEVGAAGLARYCDVFCDEHAFTAAEARKVLNAARRVGIRLRIHAEQFRSGDGGDLAAELGADTADHLESASEATLRRLATAGVQPVLLPGSVFAIRGERYPNARRMIELGLGIVLATDFNPGSSPIASIPFILSLACLEMKLSPAEALSAVTINAAYSLNRGEWVGSLETGKQADFLIHEFQDYRELAYYVAAPLRPRVFIAGCEVTPD